jgi:hypothetical protein
MPPKSYFGYVEREADSYVNWADVGRTITNTVDEIDRVRTEKKAAIDAAYKEELERINNKPIGQKDDVTKWTINLAYNAAENTKIQYNLLKSGKLAVKDFAIYLQNTNDSVKNLYGTIGQIQTAFKERLDRQANRENQKIEMWDGEDLEQYGKLTDLGANFNINGNLTFSRLETVTEDGKTITRAKPGAENLLSVNQLAGAVNSKYNYYNYLKDADEFITRLGEGITSYRVYGSEDRAGSITQITDKSGELNLDKVAALGITDQAEIDKLKAVASEYAKAEEAYINAALNPKYNKSSILTEELGYTPTDDAKEAAKKDSKLMLVQRETDGTITPLLNPDQEKEAREFLRGQYRQMIDKKLEISTYTEVGAQKQQPQRFDREAADYGKEIRTEEEILSDLGDLYFGTDNERRSALESINQYKDVNKAYFDTSGELIVIMDNGDVFKSPFGKPEMDEKNNVIGFKKGSGVGAGEAIGGIVVGLTGGRITRERAKREMAKKGNRELNYNPMFEKYEMQKDPIDIYRDRYMPNIGKKDKDTGKTLFQKPQGKAAAELSEALAGTGVTVKATGTYGWNQLTLSHPNAKKDLVFSVKEYENNAATNQQTLNTWMEQILSTLPESELSRYSKTMGGGNTQTQGGGLNASNRKPNPGG